MSKELKKEIDALKTEFLTRVESIERKLKPKSANILERVVSFETACEETGDNPNDPKFHEGEYDEVCGRKLKVISKAIREKDVIDIYDHSQKKYRGWFETTTDGTFRFDVVDYCYGIVDFPSWTFQLTEAKALHLFKSQSFLGLWKGYLTEEK
jgi:hypothetical protein